MSRVHSRAGPSSHPNHSSKNPRGDVSSDDAKRFYERDDNKTQRSDRCQKTYVYTGADPPTLPPSFQPYTTSSPSSSPTSTVPPPSYRYARVDTNETMDNLPGPGRALDNLYQSGGRVLERWMNHTAERMGFGPVAAEQKVLQGIAESLGGGRVQAVKRLRRIGLVRQSLSDSSKAKKGEKLVTQGVRGLVRYARSDIPSNQLHALNAILSLMSQYPHIRDYFEEHKAIEVIQSSMEQLDLAQKASLYDFGQDYDPDTLDELLSNSRKALVSVQDTELNRLAKRLVALRSPSIGDASVGTPCEKELLRLEREWDAHGEAFLQYLTHPELSFLALRYLNNSIFFHPFIYDFSRGAKIRASLFKKLIALVERLNQTGPVPQNVWSSIADMPDFIAQVCTMHTYPPFVGGVTNPRNPGSVRSGQSSHSLPIAVEPSELVRSAERTLAIGWMVSLSSDDDSGDDCRVWLRELETAVENQKLVVEQDHLTYADPRVAGDADVVMYVKVANQRFCYTKGVDGPRIERREIQ